MRIAFLHPDLGIGGAEKLVINCALALQDAGNEVKIITPHHDPERCLEPTRDGKLRVEVRGSCFPRTFGGRFTALCSYMRMLLASLFIVLYGGHYDVIFVDQVSAVLPILAFTNAKIVFYCHFPDKLLCVERGSALKSMYRRPIDYIEEYGMSRANVILANSRFTRRTIYDTFRSLEGTEIEVVHPCIELDYQKVDPTGVFEKI
jgi:alpha-1,3/alpha-1,6-mannosyltransferase